MEKASFAFGLIAYERHLPDSNESHQQCDELFADLHLRSYVSDASSLIVGGPQEQATGVSHFVESALDQDFP